MKTPFALIGLFFAQLTLNGLGFAEALPDNRIPNWKFELEFTEEVGRVGDEDYELPMLRVVIEGDTSVSEAMFLNMSIAGKDLAETVAEWRLLREEKVGSQSFELSLLPGQTQQSLAGSQLLIWTEKTGYRYELGQLANQAHLKGLVTREAWQVMSKASAAKLEASLSRVPGNHYSLGGSQSSLQRRMYSRPGSSTGQARYSYQGGGMVDPNERQTAQAFLEANPSFHRQALSEGSIRQGMDQAGFHSSAVVVLPPGVRPSPQAISDGLRKGRNISEGAARQAQQGNYTQKQDAHGRWIIVIPNH